MRVLRSGADAGSEPAPGPFSVVALSRSSRAPAAASVPPPTRLGHAWMSLRTLPVRGLARDMGVPWGVRSSWRRGRAGGGAISPSAWRGHVSTSIRRACSSPLRAGVCRSLA
jgi:hypothetical protein